MTLNVERWENAGGMGDRTSVISISTTASLLAGTIDNLIDGSLIADATGSAQFTTSQTSRSITFDFGSSRKSIKAFTWQKSTTGNTGTWKLQGSNDNATWFDITDPVAFGNNNNFNSPVTMFVFSNGANDGYYRYFRFLQTGGTTGSVPWLQEVWFLIHNEAGEDPAAATTPDYSHFLGSGWRRPFITIGGTITWGGNGPPPIIDGDNATGVTMSNGQSSRYIEFDFHENILITEVTWLQSNSANHGTWKWQYYDDGLASFVDAGGTFTLGGATTTVITAMSAMTTYHSVYRLTQVSGSTSNSATIFEVTFKAGNPEIEAPVISFTVSPSSGTELGGTPVSLIGDNLTGSTGVEFDGVPATSFVVVDDELITCVTPAGSPGLVNVTVLHPNGNAVLVDGFEYEEVVIVQPARMTQAPMLVMFEPNQALRVTQSALLVVNAPLQGTQITQAGSLVVNLPEPIPPPKPVIPLSPIIETWEWLTSITRSVNNREQRAALRIRPRISYRYSLPIKDEEDRRRIFDLMFRYQLGSTPYPAWQYATAVTSIVGNTIDLDLQENNLRVGQAVALLDWEEEFVKYGRVVSLGLDSVTLEEEPPSGVYHVAPAPAFRLSDENSLGMGVFHGNASVDFLGVEILPFLRPQDEDAVLDLAYGMYILPQKYELQGEVSEAFARGKSLLDIETNTPSDFSLWRNTLISSNRSYLLESESLPYWRKFFYSIRGSQKRFLLPTYRNDVLLKEVPDLGAMSLKVTEPGLREVFERDAYRHLRIESESGVIYRRVAGVIYDPEDGFPILQLDSSIGMTEGSNLINSISICMLCRLSDDRVSIEHHHHFKLLGFSVRAINE